MKLSTSARLSAAALAGILATSASAASTYTVTDLDPGNSIYPVAINNYGQIIGDSHQLNTAPSGYVGNGWVWQPTGANSPVGTYNASNFGFPKTTTVAAVGINSFGQVMGYQSTTGSASFQTFLFTPTAANSLTGSTATLPFTNSAQTSLDGGINDSGEVVANAGPQNTAIFSPTTPGGSTGTVTNFFSQGTETFYGPAAISNSGSFTGTLASQHDSTYQAGRFTPTTLNGTSGTYVDIADAGQGGTAFPGPGGGYAINSAGDIAADVSTAVGAGSAYTALWKANGQVITLTSNQYALGINDADQIVGGITTSASAFLYSGGTIYNLNSLISDPTWSLTQATGINNAGQIVGVGSHNGVNSAFLLTPAVTTSQPRQWINSGSGDWNVTSNWNGGVPNSAGAEADFFSAIISNHTVYTDIPVTVGTINFANPNTYVITGSSTLALLASTGSAQVIVQAGTQELNLPTYVASNALFNVSSGAALLIANPFTVIAGNHVGQVGAGTVTFESNITLQYGASLLLNSPAAVPSVLLGSTSDLIIGYHSNGEAALLQSASLSQAADSKIDITNNAMILQGGNLATINVAVKSGLNSRSAPWSGNGITSSTAASDTTHLTAVGAIINNDGFGNSIYGASASLGLFEGANPSAADVLVKYTDLGDANLDGKVDGSDYSRIDNAYLADETNPSQYTGWYNGDFNYDGAVNGSDYTLIDNAFNRQGTQLTEQVASATAQTARGTSAVPEPASVILLTIATALLGRRRLC